jgi:sulfite reductase (NADPH) flavoprotein alpha-component
LFGRPSKEFYIQLADYATDPKEKEALIFLTTPDGQANYKSRVEDTVIGCHD